MHDIADVIKNLQNLTVNDNTFKVLKDFERVIDELDLYVFKNWEDGEIIKGPLVNRYDVTCKLMWDRDNMPDPRGGKRLSGYGCNVAYAREEILIPRKIKDPDDFRSGTKKGKIDAHPIWIVTISMPKKLMQDIYQGYENKENQAVADMMRYDQTNAMTSENAAQEIPEMPAEEVATNAPAQA